MINNLQKRSSLLICIAILSGAYVTIVLPPMLVIGLNFWGHYHEWPLVHASIFASALAYLALASLSIQFERYPQRHPVALILPAMIPVYLLMFLVFLVLRLSYSLHILTVSFLVISVLLVLEILVRKRMKYFRFLVVPIGDFSGLEESKHFQFLVLSSPQIPKGRFDGVVVDFSLNAHLGWQSFIADCVLKGIPVFGANELRESITGQVDTTHLASNELVSLQPQPAIFLIKRVVDLAFLLFTAPLSLPLMLVIGTWISWGTPGGPLYIHERMGRGGKSFKMIKFRTMFKHDQPAGFTQKADDSRITPAGRWVRRYRLDELPQFWNVLKGEMSLVGPRPESKALAEWYLRDVPFFSYRHVVSPGITGWAQVMQGYAVGVDELKIKLAYDLYYIKHFSLWLELLIWFKTFRIMMTGSGAR
jgi:lipopolysaccharide/colanic/teichoic acid biosynthesis glycosyltransferase